MTYNVKHRPYVGRGEGFTIVELLIVIVVIGILAAITVTAFNNVQKRARDTQRVSDANGIVKSIEQYKLMIGSLPNVGYSGLGSQSGWESSAREAAGEFISPLMSTSFPSGVPVDPINDATDASDSEARANGHYGYYYHVYAAGTNGCDPSRGRHYIFGILRMEGTTGTHPQSPGFSCSNGTTSRNWSSNFVWVTGGYES